MRRRSLFVMVTAVLVGAVTVAFWPRRDGYEVLRDLNPQEHYDTLADTELMLGGVQHECLVLEFSSPPLEVRRRLETIGRVMPDGYHSEGAPDADFRLYNGHKATFETLGQTSRRTCYVIVWDIEEPFIHRWISTLLRR